MAEALHAAVYVTNDDERKLAEKLVREGHATLRGSRQGWLDADGVRALAERGIIVDPINSNGGEPVGPPTRDGRQGHVDADDPAQPAGTLGATSRWCASPSPRTRPTSPSTTSAWRVRSPRSSARAFVGYGVDLAAFEPPDSYRTRLTREQYAQVRGTPGVRAVERYGLEEKLTPHLVRELDEFPGERRTFDLVLHRIADRDAVVERLRELGIEVSEASYLFIRFEAPLDRELVANLARIRSVRRLDLYEPPSLLTATRRPLVGVEGLKWTGDRASWSRSSTAASTTATRTSTTRSRRSTTWTAAARRTRSATAPTWPGSSPAPARRPAARTRASRPEAKLAIIGFVGADGVPLIPANWADLLERAVEARRPHREPQRRHELRGPLRLRQPRARRVRVGEPRGAGGDRRRELRRGAGGLGRLPHGRVAGQLEERPDRRRERHRPPGHRPHLGQVQQEELPDSRRARTSACPATPTAPPR